jgi:hypothetical protein
MIIINLTTIKKQVESRLRHLPQHIHACGPRTVFEGSLEKIAGKGVDVLRHVASIAPTTFRAVGDDKLRIETCRFVGEVKS